MSVSQQLCRDRAQGQLLVRIYPALRGFSGTKEDASNIYKTHLRFGLHATKSLMKHVFYKCFSFCVVSVFYT